MLSSPGPEVPSLELGPPSPSWTDLLAGSPLGGIKPEPRNVSQNDSLLCQAVQETRLDLATSSAEEAATAPQRRHPRSLLRPVVGRQVSASRRVVVRRVSPPTAKDTPTTLTYALPKTATRYATPATSNATSYARATTASITKRDSLATASKTSPAKSYTKPPSSSLPAKRRCAPSPDPWFAWEEDLTHDTDTELPCEKLAEPAAMAAAAEFGIEDVEMPEWLGDLLTDLPPLTNDNPFDVAQSTAAAAPVPTPADLIADRADLMTPDHGQLTPDQGQLMQLTADDVTDEQLMLLTDFMSFDMEKEASGEASLQTPTIEAAPVQPTPTPQVGTARATGTAHQGPSSRQGPSTPQDPVTGPRSRGDPVVPSGSAAASSLVSTRSGSRWKLMATSGGTVVSSLTSAGGGWRMARRQRVVAVASTGGRARISGAGGGISGGRARKSGAEGIGGISGAGGAQQSWRWCRRRVATAAVGKVTPVSASTIDLGALLEQTEIVFSGSGAPEASPQPLTSQLATLEETLTLEERLTLPVVSPEEVVVAAGGDAETAPTTHYTLVLLPSTPVASATSSSTSRHQSSSFTTTPIRHPSSTSTTHHPSSTSTTRHPSSTSTSTTRHPSSTNSTTTTRHPSSTYSTTTSTRHPSSTSTRHPSSTYSTTTSRHPSSTTSEASYDADDVIDITDATEEDDSLSYTTTPAASPAAPSRKRRAPPAHDATPAEKYRRIRDNNNAASRRSRAQRKEREIVTEERVGVLEEENARLKREVEVLEGLLERVKGLGSLLTAKRK